ncbi:POK9 protein, partial [Pterocles burchelli]|nr:POK9 protein [Pterocles burchelli]
KGSLGLDLATTVDVTLIDTKPVRVPTGVKGPLVVNGQPCCALLLGCSSATMKGLTIAPGLVDVDFTGHINIMVYTLYPPMFLPAGSRIEQLVPLSQLIQDATAEIRGDGGFGSTGSMALLTLPMAQRPVVMATFCFNQESIRMKVLLDTGADITIVA